MKCIVQGCENRWGDGVVFHGDLCGPCHEMITTGKIKYGNTFIHKLQRELDENIALLKASNKIIADMVKEFLAAATGEKVSVELIEPPREGETR